MTSLRWHWPQSSCTSSTPPYGKQPPLGSWADLGYQLLHLYPLTSSLNPFQASTHRTQWPDSGCNQASLVPLAVPVGAWTEDMPIVCRYLVSVMETFLLYQHFRPTLELPGEAPHGAHFWLHFLLQSCQPLKTACPQGDQCLVRPMGCGTRERCQPLLTNPSPLSSEGAGPGDE